MAWMEMDYSKDTHFRWKIKWRLQHLGAPGIMGETAPDKNSFFIPVNSFADVLFLRNPIKGL